MSMGNRISDGGGRLSSCDIEVLSSTWIYAAMSRNKGSNAGRTTTHLRPFGHPRPSRPIDSSSNISSIVLGTRSEKALKTGNKDVLAVSRR